MRRSVEGFITPRSPVRVRTPPSFISTTSVTLLKPQHRVTPLLHHPMISLNRLSKIIRFTTESMTWILFFRHFIVHGDFPPPNDSFSPKIPHVEVKAPAGC